MTQKRGTSSVAALVMARTMQRLAAEYPDHDPDMMADAVEDELRALAATKVRTCRSYQKWRSRRHSNCVFPVFKTSPADR